MCAAHRQPARFRPGGHGVPGWSQSGCRRCRHGRQNQRRAGNALLLQGLTQGLKRRALTIASTVQQQQVGAWLRAMQLIAVQQMVATGQREQGHGGERGRAKRESCPLYRYLSCGCYPQKHPQAVHSIHRYRCCLALCTQRVASSVVGLVTQMCMKTQFIHSLCRNYSGYPLICAGFAYYPQPSGRTAGLSWQAWDCLCVHSAQRLIIRCQGGVSGMPFWSTCT